MEPPAEPSAQAQRTASSLLLLINKKTLDASRTEILVLALAILFLASQLCLLLWIFHRPRVAIPRGKEHCKLAIILPGKTAASSTNIDTTHDANDTTRGVSLRLRRSSTWSGRSADPDSHPRGRRKSAGSRYKAHDDDDDDISEGGVQTTLSSPGPEEPEEFMAAAPAKVLLPSPESGDNQQDTELREFDPRRTWGEVGLLAASVVKPPSPRSPRVLAADQAAMIDALCAEGEGKAAAVVLLPMVDEKDTTALASEFDDPLGANRRAATPGRNEERHEGIELELLHGRQQDA
ncbi:hypothetical protein Daus18300_003326 [Diaporthe australafricana]|uniref:Uncharacterized protein n=1 Tax=Diaporthe australafricana TaxID=127596 RepID=A0ABR3XHK9_9PEZI